MELSCYRNRISYDTEGANLLSCGGFGVLMNRFDGSEITVGRRLLSADQMTGQWSASLLTETKLSARG